MCWRVYCCSSERKKYFISNFLLTKLLVSTAVTPKSAETAATIDFQRHWCLTIQPWCCLNLSWKCQTVCVLSRSPHRSGPTSPPWGSTRMENTFWPSWKSTTWRTALTWVLCVAPPTASCKHWPPPSPPLSYAWKSASDLTPTLLIFTSSACPAPPCSALSFFDPPDGLVPTSTLQICEDMEQPVSMTTPKE